MAQAQGTKRKLPSAEDPLAPGEKRLNLGCGNDYRPGWTNVDITPDVKPDAIVNAFHVPYPLPSDHFDYVLASHILEHVPHAISGGDPERNGLLYVMEELWRVLKPGGILEVRVPYFRHRGAWWDPTHTRVVDPLQFRYFHPDFHLNFYSHARYEVADVYYRRQLEIPGVFNSEYHLPKYLGRRLNIGQRAESRIKLRALK